MNRLETEQCKASRDQLEREIRESIIPPGEVDLLCRRLKVASNEGAALVRRDFAEALRIARAKVLPSMRRGNFVGGIATPMNKQVRFCDVK